MSKNFDKFQYIAIFCRYKIHYFIVVVRAWKYHFVWQLNATNNNMHNGCIIYFLQCHKTTFNDCFPNCLGIDRCFKFFDFADSNCLLIYNCDQTTWLIVWSSTQFITTSTFLIFDTCNSSFNNIEYSRYL